MERYKTHIDIMFGDRLDSTVRNYTVDTLFGGGQLLEDMVSHLYRVKPYLRRRKQFGLYFKDESGKDVHIEIINNKQ